MSRVRPPQDEWGRINDLERRVSNLERGNPFQGSTASAVDANGTPRISIGQLTPGVWGIGMYDASGAELVQLDDAGLRVKNSAGIMQAVGGTLFAHESSPVGVSGTAGNVALGASITATIGPSGEAFAMWAGNTTTGAGGGEIFCFVDGVATGAPPAQYSGSASSTVGMIYLFTGLTPGSHTFALYGVAVAGGDNLTMSQATLALQPL